MKSAILNHGVIAVSLCLLTSCNNSSNDKTSSSTTAKEDTSATNQNLNKEPATTIPAADQQDYNFEPSVSEITGIIQAEIFYGPPGYGENPKTDKVEHFFMLILQKPINVVSTDKNADADDVNATKNNISKIQLLPADNIDLNNYIAKTVKLTGTFFGAHTGHHHTDVLMDVQKIEE